jgi:hypothetical protein
MFEHDDSYRDIDLIIALTDAPLPHLREKAEYDMCGILTTRSLMPRFT